MDVSIKGSKNVIKLNNNDFIASGGEGSIYLKNNTAFKIYANPKGMIPFAKIQELSYIKNKNVIKPENIVLDKKQNPIGYTMRHVPDSYSLCQIFPKAFRDRAGLDNETVLNLIKDMQTTISDIHNVGTIIVDLNEMNFLVNKNFKNVYFIDVDSYETKSFPATAIMESIRDWHSNKFSVLTDWFSFGIVSFQMFIGIHPFKGKHPSIKSVKERMVANIPVFHKDVKFPNVCLPFDIIPQEYKDWYKALFYDGKRVPPPLDAIHVIMLPSKVQTIKGNDIFEISEIFEYESDVIRFISIDGNRITICKNDLYISNNKIKQSCNKKIHIAVTPSSNKVISGVVIDGNACLFNSTDMNIPSHDIAAEDMMSYNGRIFVKNKDIMSELNFIDMGNEIHVIPKRIANVMENATKLFDGVAIQNMLGSFVASIFPSKGLHYQIKFNEFNGYQIIDAKYDKNILMVIGSKNGKYDKFIIKLDNNFSSYSLRIVNDITYSGINFTVLDNGITVHINDNEDIELFSNKKEADTVKVISSDIISGDMKLFSDGVKVAFAKGKKLYRLKMK